MLCSRAFPFHSILLKTIFRMRPCRVSMTVILLCSLQTAFSFSSQLKKPSTWGRPHSYQSVVSTTVHSFDTALLLSQSTELESERFGWETGSNDEESVDDISHDSSSVAEKESNMKDDEAVDSSDPLLDEYHQWLDSVNRAVTVLEKKQKSLQNELAKAEKVEETVARAQLLTTYLYMFTPGVKSAVVQDWEHDGQEVELVLDPSYHSAAEEADALFQQARKLKRGSQVVADLLKETSQALNTLQEIKTDLDAALLENTNTVDENLLRLLQDRLLRTSRTTNFSPPKDKKMSNAQDTKQRGRKPQIGTPASNLRKLASPGGCTVLVGRNRRGNEYLSLSIAKGNDIWMHSRGTPGAHVLILQRRGGGPQATDECLQFAANLAVFYSDSRSERKGLVTLAQPKHLLKPRGAPLGAVKLREEWKVLTGFPDNVPDKLKQAREESGQMAEYRREDKAKHRKRTKGRQQQQEAKRKTKSKRDRNKDRSAEDDHY